MYCVRAFTDVNLWFAVDKYKRVAVCNIMMKWKDFKMLLTETTVREYTCRSTRTHSDSLSGETTNTNFIVFGSTHDLPHLRQSNHCNHLIWILQYDWLIRLEKILVILDNGWYCDVTNVFIRQRQIQIFTRKNRNQNRGIIKFCCNN